MGWIGYMQQALMAIDQGAQTRKVKKRKSTKDEVCPSLERSCDGADDEDGVDVG